MRRRIFDFNILNLQGMSQSPFLRAIPILLILMIGWILLAELIGRTSTGRFFPSSAGADSFEFDLKVKYIEQSIRERGLLDCLITGDSMANDGLDPTLIEQSYRELTGKPLHCFNFGMPALTLEASGPLTQALADRYHPRLLIFILSPRDFVPKYGKPFRHVVDADWTQYNLGKPTLRGWAVNSLYGYRYFLFAKYWLDPPNREKFADAYHTILSNGFTPLYGQRTPQTINPPQPDFTLSDPEAMRGFDVLLNLVRSGNRVLIVDAPVNPSYFPIYLQTPENYDVSYVAPMQAVFQPIHIPFLLTRDLALTIRAKNWYDSLHVNQQGAALFSRWLGEQLAQLDVVP